MLDCHLVFFFQAEDGIRDAQESRGLGDVYKRQVHGTVKGTIIMEKGALVIAPSGKAEAQVEGSVVTVHGTVSGDLSATEKLELTDTAHVSGTISAPSLLLREGAVFNGIVDMSNKKACLLYT